MTLRKLQANNSKGNENAKEAAGFQKGVDMSIYKQGRPRKFNPAIGAGILPEHRAGEYRIRDSGGDIIYVGETNDLNRRMHQHQLSGKLDKTKGSTFEYKYADGRSTSRTRREHECSKIQQHNPLLNRSRGGEGRIANH